MLVCPASNDRQWMPEVSSLFLTEKFIDRLIRESVFPADGMLSLALILTFGFTPKK